MASGSAKFHSLIACITAAMLLGVVSGHFRVGREFHLRHQQKYPVLPERPSSRISPEWFLKSDFENTKTGKMNEEQIVNSSPTEENQIFNDDRPGYLKRLKTFFRKPCSPGTTKVITPYQVPEEGAQGGRINKNRVVPCQAFRNNKNNWGK